MRLEVQAPGHQWIAETDSSVPDASWLRLLPLTMRAVQSEWSGDVMELFDGPGVTTGPVTEPVPFQYPGLIVYEPRSGRLALCFGQGRLQDGFGPLPAFPVARIVAGLDRLTDFGRTLQFVGAQNLTISLADESAAGPAADEDAAGGRPIEIGLGDAVARGVLLERTSPNTAASLGRLLPLRGKATNTFASGPFTRFWNDAGGTEGATPLETGATETAADGRDHSFTPDRHVSLAAPGFVYYMTTPPWHGLRIAARGATMMKSALPGGGRSTLVPVARFTGDWSAFSDVAADLRFTGALSMFIRFSE